MTKDVWIAGINRGHNAGLCLIKNGEIVYNNEEERYSREKYDGSPIMMMQTIKKYTDKLDYLILGGTQPATMAGGSPFIEYSGDNLYVGIARKMRLIADKSHHTVKKSDYKPENPDSHPQVIDVSLEHHKTHAFTAFCKSGFDTAACVVVDGAGSFLSVKTGIAWDYNRDVVGWEVESIYHCDRNDKNYPINTMFKSVGCRENVIGGMFPSPNDHSSGGPTWMRNEDPEKHHVALVHDRAGIVKAYEATTVLLGWHSIEAGKTMGLAPYGNDNPIIESFRDKRYNEWPLVDRDIVLPTYPNGGELSLLGSEKTFDMIKELRNMEGNNDDPDYPDPNRYELQSAKDYAWQVQNDTQQMVLEAIIKAKEITGETNIVLTGGYALNCVANYWYLDKLKEHGINLYVEPVSSDAGIAMGAALYGWHTTQKELLNVTKNIYTGEELTYTQDAIEKVAEKYGAQLIDTTMEQVVDLIANKNIVAIFQGRSESGPRALGNRSILYDPRDPDGKDHVNTVKHREFFRPFAGSILKEHVHEWFDLRGMDETPHMMYAVDCQPGVQEKIPAIIHVDGTCRIQTVTEEDNPVYRKFIETWYEKTGCPIIFNTSFNLGGEPLVETLEDAIRTLARSKIEYCYLAEYDILVKVINEQETTKTD